MTKKTKKKQKKQKRWCKMTDRLKNYFNYFLTEFHMWPVIFVSLNFSSAQIFLISRNFSHSGPTMVSNYRAISQISGSRNYWNVKCFDEKESTDLQRKNGCNVIFICYMLNREMISYSCVQSFFETYIWKCHSSITNIIVPSERGVDLKS